MRIQWGSTFYRTAPNEETYCFLIWGYNITQGIITYSIIPCTLCKSNKVGIPVGDKLGLSEFKNAEAYK